MHRTTFLFVLFIIEILFYSCSKDEHARPVPPVTPVDTTVHVTSISVTPVSIIMLPGTKQYLSVTISPGDASNKKIIWSSTNPSVASVDSSGLIIAYAEGSVSIVVSSAENRSIKFTVSVRVLKKYDVYVVGRGPTLEWTNCALYWKNDIVTALRGGINVGSRAYAITLSGEDIYIAGCTQNSNLWDIATFWKNNVPVQISDSKAEYNTYATAIVVSGDKVFTTGYSFFNTGCPNYCYGYSHALYWKTVNNNTTEIPLYNNATSTEATGIAISGNDVLIAGSDARNNFYRMLTVWRNQYSDSLPLTEGPNYFKSSAIATNGADVYVAGYGGCPNTGCIRQAKLWQNNKDDVVALSNGMTHAEARCLAISNGIVHVGGYEQNSSGKLVAMYWKVEGNNVTSIPLSDGTHDAIVSAIAVSENDIFLAGSERDTNEKTRAKYWRRYDGVPTSISVTLPLLGSNDFNGSEANGIFIK